MARRRSGGAQTPEFLTAFGQDSTINTEEFLERLSEAMGKRAVRLAKQTVDSAALVFSHTLLDDILSECCWIICRKSGGLV